MLKLRGVEQALATFLGQGLLALGGKLGPLRLHGDAELYVSGYGDAALDDWARRIRAWQRGGQPRDARRATRVPVARTPRDVYCYFDNDAKVHAPFDAQALAARLGVG